MSSSKSIRITKNWMTFKS